MEVMEIMEIEDLYALLPDMQCIEGCIDCCKNFGVPSRGHTEDKRLKEYLRENGREIKQAQGTTCPYVTEKGCSVYPVRPLTCRLYGSSVNYQCHRGAAPLRLLDEDEEAELFQFYYANFV